MAIGEGCLDKLYGKNAPATLARQTGAKSHEVPSPALGTLRVLPTQQHLSGSGAQRRLSTCTQETESQRHLAPATQ